MKLKHNEFRIVVILVIAIVFVGALIVGGVFVSSKLTVLSETLVAVKSKVTRLEVELDRLASSTRAVDEELGETRRSQEEQGSLVEEQLEKLGTAVVTQTQQLEQLAAEDVAAIVAQWEPFIYRLTCRIPLPDGEADEGKGSATVEHFSGGTRFVTNKHVLETEDSFPSKCYLSKPDSDEKIVIPGRDITYSETQDIGYGRITISGVAGVDQSQRCSETPNIGDKVVILGYPKIGGEESITATEGIISGFDDGFYITSAKIERGNSGGSAIHVKNNCVLGIPTLVVSGRIEALARILPVF